MKNKILMSLIFALSLFQGNPLNAQNQSREQQINNTIHLLEEGWNAKSGNIFASAFADTHDYIIWDGRFTSEMTKEMNAKGHQRIFDSIYKNTNLALDVNKVKMLGDDLALVHVYGTTWRNEKTKPENPGVLISMILEQQEDQWQIISFHNSDVENGTGSNPNIGQWYAGQETKIKDNASAMIEAFNNRDAKLTASFFTEECAHTVSGQQHEPNFSNEALLKHYDWLFSTIYKEKGNTKIKHHNVQFLNGNTALVHLKLTPLKEKSEIPFINCIFERDIYDQWLIRSFNLSEIVNPNMDQAKQVKKEKTNQ